MIQSSVRLRVPHLEFLGLDNQIIQGLMSFRVASGLIADPAAQKPNRR